MEIQNGSTTLGDRLVDSYKTKYILVVWSSSCLPWCLSKGAENLYLHTNLKLDICSRFIHNFPNLDVTKMSSSRWKISKLQSIQTVEYYLALKRNELISHEKTWSNLKCILSSERNQSEDAANYMIATTWHSGKGKPMETVKKWVVTRSWLGGEVSVGGGVSRHNFEDSENTLHDIIMMDTYIWIHKCTTQEQTITFIL